ncbi:RICIN domain-containing protein [Dactylosporangium cerinum]
MPLPLTTHCCADGTGTVNRIIGQGSNRCVDISGGRTTDGAAVQLWDCLGNGAQQWRRQGTPGSTRSPASAWTPRVLAPPTAPSCSCGPA